MKDILSDEARPVLEEIARRRMLLAFDFDGTLARVEGVHLEDKGLSLAIHYRQARDPEAAARAVATARAHCRERASSEATRS